MDVKALQGELARLGFYKGSIDGAFGPVSRAAMREALKAPADRLSAAALAAEAKALGVTAAHVGAVYDVESAGRGVSPSTGLPVILFEPHVFSRLTQHRYDASHPEISYRNWKTRPYPATQTGRWDQLLAAVALDPEAALQSASWGLGQVMGFNYAQCGFATVWGFVRSMAGGEAAQFSAMLDFIEHNGLTGALKRGDWRAFAGGYNGPGQVELYAGKLAAAFAKRGGR